MLKILEWDSNDSTFTELIQNFYNSSDVVQISKALMIKKKNMEFVLSTDATNTVTIPLTNQSNVKFGDLNILTSKGIDLLYRGAIEKIYFEAKSSQKYSHSNKPEVYNKYENFLDLTNEGMLNIPLQTIHNLYAADSTTTDIMSLSNGCFAKHIFNIKSIEPNRVKTYTYANLISYYQNTINGTYLFKNYDQILRSTLSINRYLQDIISSVNRTSTIVFQSIEDSASMIFYSLYYDDFSLKGSINNVHIPYSHLHLRIRSNGDYEKYFDSSSEIFDIFQSGLNFDYIPDYTLFGISPTIPDSVLEDPIDMVFDGCPKKQDFTFTSLGDFSIDLNSYIDIDATAIASCEILDNKIIRNLTTSFSAVYNLKFKDTNNKIWYIPIDLRLSIADNTVYAVKVVDNTQSIIHPCTSLNTTYNTGLSKQVVNQDIYTISQVRSNQSYSLLYNKNDFSTGTTNVITGNLRITSAAGKISTIDGIYQNRCNIVDRNTYRIHQDTFFNNLAIIDDYAFYINSYTGDIPISLQNRLPYINHHLNTMGYINHLNGNMKSMFWNSLNTGDCTAQYVHSNSGSIRCHIDYEDAGNGKNNIMFNMIDQIKHMTYNIPGYTNYNIIKRDTNAIVIGSYYDSIGNILYFLEYDDGEYKFSTFNFNKMTYNSHDIPNCDELILSVTNDPIIKLTSYGMSVINVNTHIYKYDIHVDGNVPMKIEQTRYDVPEFLKTSKQGIIDIDDLTVNFNDGYHNRYEIQYTIDSSVQNYKTCIISHIEIKDVGDINSNLFSNAIRSDKTTILGFDGTYAVSISDINGIELYYDNNRPIFDNTKEFILYDRTTQFYSQTDDLNQILGKKHANSTTNSIDNTEWNSYLIFSYNYETSKIKLLKQIDSTNINIFDGYAFDISSSSFSRIFDFPSNYFDLIYACGVTSSDSTYLFIGNKNGNDLIWEGTFDTSSNLQTQIKSLSINSFAIDISSYRPALSSQITKVQNSYLVGSIDNKLFSINTIDSSTAMCKNISTISIYNNIDIDFISKITEYDVKYSQNGSSCIYIKGSPFDIRSMSDEILTVETKFNSPATEYCLSTTVITDELSNIISSNSKVLYDNTKYYALIDNQLYIICSAGEGFYNKSGITKKNVQSIQQFNDFSYDNTMIIGYEFGDSIYFPISCISDQELENRTFTIKRIYKNNLGWVNIEHSIKGIYSNNDHAFSQFSYSSYPKINFAIDGNIFSYNPTTDDIDNVNIGYGWKGSSDIHSNNKKYAYVSPTNTKASAFYAIDSNKQYLLPDIEKENITDTSFSSILVNKNSLVSFSVGNNSYAIQPTWDSICLNLFNLFYPRGINESCAYLDDDNNTLVSQNGRYNIISNPLFYSNIFSPTIDINNFDPNISCIYTSNDDKYWILGSGQYQYKNQFDKIVVHKTLISDEIMIRTTKINDELCINNKALKFLKSNNNISSFTFNKDRNILNSNVTVNCFSDFSISTITHVTDNSVTVGGIIYRNQNFAIEYESSDQGRYQENSTYYKTSGKLNIPTITDSTLTTLHSFEISNDGINWSDITSYELLDFNNFNCTIQVYDSTSESCIIKLRSQYNSFEELYNKESQLSYVSYYELNDSTKFMFLSLPENQAIIKINMLYIPDYLDDNDVFFNSKFDSIYIDSTIEPQFDIFYTIPIFYDHTSNVMWIYNDADNILSSMSLSDGNIIHQDSSIQIVYKWSSKPETMNIRYKEFNANGFIYYECILGSDGNKQSVVVKDVITTFILQNKNIDTSGFILVNNGSSLDITYSGRTQTKIYLGNDILYQNANWFHESSDFIVLDVGIKDRGNESNRSFTLLLNKNSQTYDVVGKKYQTTILDNSIYIDENIIITDLLFNSSGILENKSQSDYIFSSYLYSYYNKNTGSIKYLDLTNGLLYSLKNMYIYDGCFMSSTGDWSNGYFSIQNSLYPFMQYLDKLPDIMFSAKNNLPKSDINIYSSQYDYIYDKTTLSIYNTRNKYVDQIKVKMDVITYIDQNKALIDYVTPRYLKTETNTLYDITNIMSYGYIVIKTKDKSREAPLVNRLIKVKFDTTFDLENLISVDTGSVAYNPFNSVALGWKMCNDLNQLQSDSSIYNEIKDTSSNLANSLLFNFESIDEPFKNFFETINDNTCTIEFYLEPSLNDEVIFIPFNLFSNLGCMPNGNDMPLSTFQKLYYPELNGSVSIEHRPEMYEVLESKLVSRVDTRPYLGYNFSTQRSEVLPFDIIDFEITENDDKLSDWLLSFNDGTDIAKDHNIVIGFTHDPELSIGKKPIDPLYPWVYNGSVNLSKQLGRGITLRYPYNTHVDGTFKYYDDINSDRIIFDITNINFPNKIQATISFQAQNSSNVLVFDGQEVIDTTNLTTHREVILGAQGIIANRISINIIVTDGTFIFDGLSFILRNKGADRKFIGIKKDGTELVYNTYEKYLCEDGISILKMNLIEGNKFSVVVEKQPNDNVNRVHTLYVIGLDCELHISHNKNYQYLTENQAGSNAVGFVIRVKPDNARSVPVFEIHDDEENDIFNDINKFQLICNK